MKKEENRGVIYFHKRLSSMLSKLDTIKKGNRNKHKNRLITDVQIILVEIESKLNGGV